MDNKTICINLNQEMFDSLTRLALRRSLTASEYVQKVVFEDYVQKVVLEDVGDIINIRPALNEISIKSLDIPHS